MVLPSGGYGDGNFKVWDARTGKVQTQTEKMPDMVSSLAMEGNIAAAGDYDGNLMVCDVRTGEEQSTMETMPDKISSLSMEGNIAVAGFVVFNAYGCGTGSGLGCLMLKRMSGDYGQKSKFSLTVWHCPLVATVGAEPYNTVLCAHSLL